MNYTNLLTSPTFFELLLEIDIVIAEQTRLGGCFFCGGRLHTSNWIRAGYGIPEACQKEVFDRHSFTCGCCDKRCTPNSLRFMYYRWYATSVELVVAAFQQEENKEAQKNLREALGISQGTLAIFKKWWKEKFSASIFEKRSPLSIASTSSHSTPSLILKYFEKSSAFSILVLKSSVSFLSSYRTDRLWLVFKARTCQGGAPPLCVCSPFFMG